jgi:hypothetical protein
MRCSTDGGDERDEHELERDELDRRIESVRGRTAAVIPWDEARRQILYRKMSVVVHEDAASEVETSCVG